MRRLTGTSQVVCCIDKHFDRGMAGTLDVEGRPPRWVNARLRRPWRVAVP